MNDVPEFYAADRGSWREWLVQNHATAKAVWLVYDKGAGRTLKWEDIVREELCFGWVDGRAMSVSDTQSKIYISRRKPKSMWSKINKAHVEQLIVSGQMQPAGMAAIETAKQNGSWDSLNKIDDMIMPPELAAALQADPVAAGYFAGFSISSRKMILQWIYSAKRDETYQKRISETVRLAHDGIKAR